MRLDYAADRLSATLTGAITVASSVDRTVGISGR
jgi:hypothetical protein